MFDTILHQRFENRAAAGQALVRRLRQYAGRTDTLVLALPRGGVPVAFEVARALRAPLDVFIVRKLGVPGHPELAMGAIASGGDQVLNDDVIHQLNLQPEDIDRVAATELREISRQERAFRGDRPAIDVRGRIVILIDDGLATGATMRAAAQALRAHAPQRVVVGVPVAAPEACEEFRDVVDEVICAITPDPFYAVGVWYSDFSQTSDDEVRDLLARARLLVPGTAGG